MSFNVFESDKEKEVVDSFLENGYYIFKIENLELLKSMRKKIFEYGKMILPEISSITEDAFFDKIQEHVPVQKLNDFRLGLINKIAADDSFRPNTYKLAQKYLNWIIGNEVALQRTINLSIQMPKDDSSLLPIHADVWSGNSPYEVVFWMPLVDCFKTKSMYLLPKKKSDEVYKNFTSYSKLNAEEFFQKIKNDVVWMDVPFGSGIIFSHSLPHGNCINEEKTTRWTFNFRIKSLLSPYGTKGLGESFLPYIVRPATRIGYEYKTPSVVNTHDKV